MPIRPIFPGVSNIDLPWCNAWLLHEGRDAVIIDTGTCRDRAAVSAALKEALPNDYRISNVLLTHGHVDHAGNAAFLAEQFGAELIAHRLEEPYVAGNGSYAPTGIRVLGASSFIFHMGDLLFPVARRKVDRLVVDGESIDTPIGPLRVVHTPGHTIGHVSYFHEENGWLFSGDALITVIPFVRRPGLCLPMAIFSQDVHAGRASAERIAEIGPSALLAGHGWAWTENVSERIREFMLSVRR